MHNGKYRNQSHNFQTPEIPWKPQLRGKPTNEGFIIQLQQIQKIITTMPNLAISSTEKYAWI
jgi:hypothetical protein